MGYHARMSVSIFNAAWRRWLASLGIILLSVIFCSHAQPEPVASGSTDITQPTPDHQTLAYHLATNAVGYARSYSGKYGEMLLLSNWTYAAYSRTNLGLLTNAVWSSHFWLHGVRGLTATAIGYSNGLGGQGLVTMVSPRHYLFATHMHPEGYLIAFLDTNNVISWRKTLQRADVATDTSVGILNADLAPSVGYLPVAPPDLSRYLSANGSSIVQGVGMNQSMLLFSQPMFFGNPSMVLWNSQSAVPLGLGTNWNVGIRGGDSSDPDMLLIGNQLVLVSHHSAISAGPNYASQINAINQSMHFLSTNNHVGTDYQLTIFSLTNWPAMH